MDEGKITINHQEIIEWADKYGGKPAIIDDPTAGNDPIGIKIDFPGKEDEKFLSEKKQQKDVSWEEFFRIFDNYNLAFVYEDRNHDDPTMLYRFINREYSSPDKL